MSDPVFWHRLQFGFTAAYHYLFPQLSMGLAVFIVLYLVLAKRTGREEYRHAARFWIRIFGVNFAVGVVTGIPMESTFLGVLLWGEGRFGRRVHGLAAWALLVGSWLSGYFIITTNAFMQHPVGHRIAEDGCCMKAFVVMMK